MRCEQAEGEGWVVRRSPKEGCAACDSCGIVCGGRREKISLHIHTSAESTQFHRAQGTKRTPGEKAARNACIKVKEAQGEAD